MLIALPIKTVPAGSSAVRVSFIHYITMGSISPLDGKAVVPLALALSTKNNHNRLLIMLSREVFTSLRIRMIKHT